MKKIAIALAAAATIAAMSAPAEARGGRNAAIGLGIAAGAIAAGVAANSYNSYDRPYYGAYGYDAPYSGNGYYYGRRNHYQYNNHPSPVDMNPYSAY